jgi:hypothetical protein
VFSLNDKRRLIEKLIETYYRKMEVANTAMKGSQQDAIEAEGRMKTRYGSTKEEKQMLMDAYAGRVVEYQKVISILKQVPIKETEIVEVMSLVGCCSDDGQYWHIIVPVGGGEEIGLDELPKFTSLSYSSPLAKALLGAKVDDKRKFGDRIFHIEYVV